VAAPCLVIDRQRARKPKLPIEDSEETSIIDIQQHLDGKLNALRVVHKALIALPKHQQVVLILVYYRDYTVKEVSVKRQRTYGGIAPGTGT
jgi:DNA-directed RNA polymerase specialized sigma24 family protein